MQKQKMFTKYIIILSQYIPQFNVILYINKIMLSQESLLSWFYQWRKFIHPKINKILSRSFSTAHKTISMCVL